MNEIRVKQCIEMMRNAKNVDMLTWQQGGGVCKTLEELHACGNPACFGGTLALDPHFIADGGRAGLYGIPLFKELGGKEAVALYLDISEELGSSLVHGDTCGGVSYFYNKPFDKVDGNDVADKLQLILDGEFT